ncbi:hypothetical protein KC842_02895 [Candidatus Nomurabacteria bacterium]|nr:hypothetical protein [Candidatus Nomurabacteria bacterium]USN94538.1 MAG: hypothetical protein H6791_02125 [Candidatus Nomurabacteria bacterium]
MENKKTLNIFLGFLAIAFLVVVFFVLKPEPQSEVVEKPQPQRYCFLNETQSGDLYDRYIVDLTNDEGDISGEVSFLPSEKDKKTGSISGTLSDATSYDFIKSVWSSSAEGMNVDEELYMKMYYDHIELAAGEMEERNGEYFYSSPETLSYSMSLDSIDCFDLDTKTDVAEYIQENIGELAGSGVLGGEFYTVSTFVDPRERVGTVIYEDGHIREKATFAFEYSKENGVKILYLVPEEERGS